MEYLKVDYLIGGPNDGQAVGESLFARDFLRISPKMPAPTAAPDAGAVPCSISIKDIEYVKHRLVRPDGLRLEAFVHSELSQQRLYHLIKSVTWHIPK